MVSVAVVFMAEVGSFIKPRLSQSVNQLGNVEIFQILVLFMGHVYS